MIYLAISSDITICTYQLHTFESVAVAHSLCDSSLMHPRTEKSNFRSRYNKKRKIQRNRLVWCTCQRCQGRPRSVRSWKSHNPNTDPALAEQYQPTVSVTSAIGRPIDNRHQTPTLTSVQPDATSPDMDVQMDLDLDLPTTLPWQNYVLHTTPSYMTDSHTPRLVDSSSDESMSEDDLDVDSTPLSDQSDVSEDDLDLDLTPDHNEDIMQQLLQEAFMPLYTGSDITVLACITIVYRHHAKYKTKRASMNSIFDILHWTLPSGHNLPPFSRCSHTMQVLGGLSITKVPCCSQCDFVFYDRPPALDPHGLHQFTRLTHCPKCNTPKLNSHGQPEKVFTWIGINTQLQKRYSLISYLCMQSCM